ncbi:hypothetical protein FHG87_011258 [Trinorchestia longiramus]|nr:hypothetical protein FHG87_011258 [Trinorchestia longiramus]
MKACFLCVLILVVVTAATQTETATYSKMEMKNADLARMVSEALLGERQSGCSGLCTVHFADHVCYPGVERASCRSGEYPVGPHPDTSCYCCLIV